MITVSPFFTACPTLALILRIFPAAPASTLIEPAPALAFLTGATGALGALAATGAAPLPAPYSTVTSYTFPFTVIV